MGIASAARDLSSERLRMSRAGLLAIGIFLLVGITSIAGCARSTSESTIRVGGQPRTYEYMFMAGGFAKRFDLHVVMDFLPSAAEASICADVTPTS